jgi:polyketide synthase PksM
MSQIEQIVGIALREQLETLDRPGRRLAVVTTSMRAWLEECSRLLAQQDLAKNAGVVADELRSARSQAGASSNGLDQLGKLIQEGRSDARVAKRMHTILSFLPRLMEGQIASSEALEDQLAAMTEAIPPPVSSACENLKRYVRARFRSARSRPIRILELGSRSEGPVFMELAGDEETRRCIAQYDYAEKRLPRRGRVGGLGTDERWPFFRAMDLDRASAEEAAALGAYDVVVATHVLHRTRNVRSAIRVLKSLVKRNGILLATELCDHGLSSHLGFGLLDLELVCEDGALRIPGSNGLSSDTWRRLLDGEGFRGTQVLSAAGGEAGTGQRLLLCESDGVVRRPRAATAATAGATAEQRGSATFSSDPQPRAPRAAVAVGVAVTADPTRPMAPRAIAEIRERISASIAKVLGIEAGDIESDRSFSEYGVDSIVAVKLARLINEQCEVRLPTTVLFDYPNIVELSAHVAKQPAKASTRATVQPPAELTENRPPEPVPVCSESAAPVIKLRPSQPDTKIYPAIRGTFRRILIDRPQEVSELRIVTSRCEPCGATDVRIAVRAFSLNFSDLLCVRGLYPSMPPYPFTPGAEVSGVVIEVGLETKGFQLGDAVIAMMGGNLGGHAEIVICDHSRVFLKPAALDFEEACSLPAVGLSMLEVFRKAQLKPGERILLQSAAGGTGLVALQLAMHAGAEIVATAGSAAKLEHLARLGAAHCINYREDDFEAEVMRVTNGKGVDVIVNTLGGDALQKGLRCLAPGGRYIEIAMTALKSARTIDLSSLDDNQSFHSVDLGRLARRTPERMREDFQLLMEYVGSGVVRPTVSRVVAFDSFTDAYGLLESRSNIGKVVVSVPGPEPGPCRMQASKLTSSKPRAAIGDNGIASPTALPETREAIAVIGLSGRFAKAGTLAELWGALVKGADLTDDVASRSRLWPTARSHSKTAGVCNRGGFLRDIDCFDPLFFNISGIEATYMDPQQRLFLEEAWKTLEIAGYAGQGTEGRRCGVYVGCSAGDYMALLDGEGAAQSFLGNAACAIPARISYYLNLQGPALAIDTACSSSLVAVHLACQSLWSGESEMALAGGVFTQCTSAFYSMSGAAGILSPNACCRAFDEAADGFVPGEGVGAVLLKPLSKAIADGDQVYGLIRGSGINHDGRTNGITAPSALSQERLERQVYQTFGVDPAEIQMLEAHGTGTKLGDPIEVRALTGAFRGSTNERQYCAIGSVKTNIGHCAGAAGIAGLLKVLLALQHRQIPPTLNFRRPNAEIDFEDSPFYVNTVLRDWPAGVGPRLAAVSSFGFSGTNAHVVLEEAPSLPHVPSAAAAHLIVLSAREPGQLRQQAQRLLAHCEAFADADCADISFTLLMGRRHFKHRLACVVRDVDDLVAVLREWVAKECSSRMTSSHSTKARTGPDVERMLSDVNDRLSRDAVGTPESIDVFDQLALLFVLGGAADFEKIFDGKRRRIALPTYPFAMERYWPETGSKNTSAVAGAACGTTIRHPLLQHDRSTREEHSYSTELSGAESFIRDHVVAGRRLMPGVIHLEMARAALQEAAGESPFEVLGLSLSDVVWSRVLDVSEGREVAISLRRGPAASWHFEIDAPDDEGVRTVHVQGEGRFRAVRDRRVDLTRLRAGCGPARTAQECYERFRQMGIEYGPALQGLQRLWSGEDDRGRFALGEIMVPQETRGAAAPFGLSPSVLDGALQAAVGLLSDRPAVGLGSAMIVLPFSLDELHVDGRCSDHSWVCVRESGHSCESLRQLDLELCDDTGKVWVTLSGLSLRKSAAPKLRDEECPPSSSAARLVPLWEPLEAQPGADDVRDVGNVLVVGGCGQEHASVRERYGAVRVIAADAGQFWKVLAGNAGLDHVIWLLPTPRYPLPDAEDLIERQESGVMVGLALVKALLKCGYDTRPLLLTVITRQAQAVLRDEQIDPTDASVHGFIGSLGKEYAHWKIRLADIGETDEIPWSRMANLPTEYGSLGYRKGEWYRQELVPCKAGTDCAVPYRKGGVYVVIGGAGGIGQVFTEHVVRNYDAQVIWIGRRKADEKIRASQDIIGRFGRRPQYLQLDATDRQALLSARERILRDHGSINGVVHAAIVLRDRSLMKMQEDEFREALFSKVAVSVRMAQAFGRDALDFIVFFSSLQSLARLPGQSNYAAGCTFKDAHALELARTLRCAVKIMNWGYWGSLGIVANPQVRERMLQQNIDSIEASEGMAALDALMSGPLGQLAVVAATPAGLRSMAFTNLGASMDVLPEVVESISGCCANLLTPTFPSNDGRAAMSEKLRSMEDCIVRIVCGELRALGAGGRLPIQQWFEVAGIHYSQERWISESFAMLENRGYLTIEHDRVAFRADAPNAQRAWQEWNANEASWFEEEALAAQARLARTTLGSLKEILTGEVPATQVMFPDSSMALVEGIYKKNEVADYFNEVLSDQVVGHVRELVRRGPGSRLRILEIGAGTGGTSASVLERLWDYREHIAEYAYTDLSKAFLSHAREHYESRAPYLSYKILDIERSPGEQGIEVGAYDMVIAANVLHATRNIRNTLRNAKAILRKNGILMLNEIVVKSVLPHVTFGLLEGWWRFEDDAVRLGGTPALGVDGWKHVLNQEGFDHIALPSAAASRLGLQIIVAESDGLVRGKRASEKTGAPRSETTKISDSPRVGDQAFFVQTQPHDETNKDTVEPMPTGELRRRTTAWVTSKVSQALRINVAQIDASEPLECYGLDSILVVRLSTALKEGIPSVTSALIFQHRTIEELVEHLLRNDRDALQSVTAGAEAEGDPSEGHSPTSVPLPAARLTVLRESHAKRSSDVAIIGLSGRYPRAANLDELWERLRAGESCIGEIPPERFDWRDFFSSDRGRVGCLYTRWGGFIEGIDQFDAAFFRISPREAQHMDPQERVFLQEAYRAIENAGHVPKSLSSTGKVGVFVGVMNNTYTRQPSHWSIANRVSYLFDFNGPSLAVDTACSSSMTAIHLAVESLQSDSCECAIAGGVSLITHPDHYLNLSVSTMLSSGPECRAFAADADGMVDGEGVGVAVLKPLWKAVEDGDHIHAIIKGSMINACGRTHGYSVPDPAMQAQVVRGALERAGIEARSVSYIEAHGTGTPLGDPIEIAGLSQAFRQDTAARQFCAIGSIKTNIGHCESAAGIAGLSKVVLQMRHGMLVPSLYAEATNPEIDFAGSPFVVQRDLATWSTPSTDARSHPRVAGISSFGAGGANAHVVLEEYTALPMDKPVVREGQSHPRLVLVSARNAEQLNERVRLLLQCLLSGQWREDDLADIAYTLHVGREEMEWRLAVKADTLDELKGKCEAWLLGNASADVICGEVKAEKERHSMLNGDEDFAQLMDAWYAKHKYSKLMEGWVQGMALDPERLHGRGRHRVPLPSYPFAKDRHWVVPRRSVVAGRQTDRGTRGAQLFSQLAGEVASGAADPRGAAIRMREAIRT